MKISGNYDLVLRPSSGARFHDGTRFVIPTPSIGINGNTISKIGDIPEVAGQVEHVIPDDHIICPGLVDGHAHLAKGSAWAKNMHLEEDFTLRGTVLVIDAGSNGHLNFEEDLLQDVINDRSQLGNVLAYLHIAPTGLKEKIHESWNPKSFNPDETFKIADKYKDLIVGIKIRLAFLQCKEENWIDALKKAKQVAEALQKPLMIHIGHGPSLREILEVLDDFNQAIIFTHCFHGHSSSSILNYSKTEWDTMIQRGVLFDMGNGEGSFSRRTCGEALDRGFTRFTVSTDLHDFSKPAMAIDMPHCMSKIHSFGKIELSDLIAMSTHYPALAIGRADEYGQLQEGRSANITVLNHRKTTNNEFLFYDYQHDEWRHNERFDPAYVVVNGKFIACSQKEQVVL